MLDKASTFSSGLSTVLALDLGTLTGWARHTRGMPVASGCEHFANSRHCGGGMRFLRFQQWLDEVHSASAIHSVYYEEVRRHAGVDAAHCYGGFLATLTAWCELLSIPYLGIPVGTIKKSATGKGNASKDQMLAAARGWGFAPCDDNEADALAILRYAMLPLGQWPASCKA